MLGEIDGRRGMLGHRVPLLHDTPSDGGNAHAATGRDAYWSEVWKKSEYSE